VPSDIPHLTAWIDPAQDMYVEGERIAAYTEHSAARRVFLPDPRPEYQPIFHAGAHPTIEFPSQCFGMTTTGVNLGLDGLTFVVVCQPADNNNFPMKVVSGPDADGWELRHDGTGTQVVERYTTHGIAYATGLVDGPGMGVYVLRVQAAVRTDVWVNAATYSAGAAAAHNQPLALYIARREGGYEFRGTMAEVLVYAGPVSDADLTKLRDYLRTKHSLTGVWT